MHLQTCVPCTHAVCTSYSPQAIRTPTCKCMQLDVHARMRSLDVHIQACSALLNVSYLQLVIPTSRHVTLCKGCQCICRLVSFMSFVIHRCTCIGSANPLYASTQCVYASPHAYMHAACCDRMHLRRCRIPSSLVLVDSLDLSALPWPSARPCSICRLGFLCGLIYDAVFKNKR